MAVVPLTQARRDAQLKKKYIASLKKLGIRDPGLLSRIEAYLTPKKIEECRADMEAVVNGEPPPPRR